MNRRERKAAARDSRKAVAAGASFRTTTPRVGDPAALHAAGLAHRREGRPLDAQLCCERALALDAGHADSLYLIGLLSLEAGQPDHAVEWLSRAVRREPRPDYLANLGTALQRLGRYEEALKVLDAAVQISPDDAELWRQMGDILVQLARFDQALLSFQHVLRFDLRHQDALYKSGALLNQFGRYEEALAHLDRSEAVLRDHVPTLQARARTLYNLKRFEQSLAAGLRAYQFAPDNADLCNNIGAASRALGRDQEALEWFDKALQIRPGLPASLDNKIIALFQLHRFDEIFTIYDHMRSRGLNSPMTDWNVSLAHLVTGNFAAGWTGHQSRLKLPSATYPKFSQRMWLGQEDVAGKTVVICADEGLGDTIHFVRYAPMLAERGARVILVVQDVLRRLLSGLSGVELCAPISAVRALPPFDLHCPVSSLPLAFKTRLDTIPSAHAYLPIPAEPCVRSWDDRLGASDRLRVGLVWSGSPTHPNDANRSIPLALMSRLLDIDATFVSLQKDPRPDEKALLQPTGIIDLTAGLTDFADTAALVRCLDLVITVDTSVAHLAAALGCPTWVLLPWTPDYRWLLDREYSPWYPTMRLFRQNQTGNYAEVLDRVRRELLARVAQRRPAVGPNPQILT